VLNHKLWEISFSRKSSLIAFFPFFTFGVSFLMMGGSFSNVSKANFA